MAGPGSGASLDDWLAFGESLHSRAIDMGLARVQALREALGLDPRFPIFTVAGTNGKGSTCAMLASMLRAAGYRVGVYSSPHLVRFNERVRIHDEPATDAVLCAAFACVEAARGDTPLTLFEFGTLVAMCVFDQSALDVAVLEVGLGGRLDAVNVFDADCAIVTSIGIDHVDYLGGTRELIGREKAGVFRAGRPAVSADPMPPAALAEEAHRVGAALRQSGRDYRIHRQADSWSLSLVAEPGASEQRFGPFPLPALQGSVQVDNAAACVLALHALADRLPVTPAHIGQGLQRVRLAGRFQRWRRDATSPEVLLDVAHNPHAAERLASTLGAHPVPGRCLAVFAMLRDKDMAGTARAMADRVDAWFVGGIDERRGASADEVAAALDAAQVRQPVWRCASPIDAYHQALAQARPDDRVLVFGSFATVGAVLAAIGAPD